MRQILDKLAKDAVTADLYSDTRFPPSLYYRFLRLLTKELKPKVAVELGVSGGGGSLYMAWGNARTKVIGIDIVEDHKERTDYIKAKFPNFQLLIGDSIELARSVYEKHGKIDLLFIDTDHTYERTIAEFEAWKPFLSNKAIVCFDDLKRHQTGAEKSMQDAWDMIPGFKARYDHLHDGIYPHGGGFGVVYKKPVLVQRCKSCG